MDYSSFEEAVLVRARRAARTRFTSFDDLAVAAPGGLFAHVVNGRVAGWGVEPVGDVIVDLSDRLERNDVRARVRWDRVAATAATAVAVAASAAAAAVSLTRRRVAPEHS